MANQGETITLNLDANFGDAVKAAESLERVRQEQRELQDAFDAGKVSLSTYRSEMAQLGEAESKLERQSAAASKAMTAIGSAAKTHTEIAGAGFSNLSNKLQVFGQTLDDAGYIAEQGLRPVIGNLMQMSPWLGIAAIGVDFLWKNWGKFDELLGHGHTETEAERMERLEKATHKTAEETKELAKYKKLQADIESASATQSKFQKGAMPRRPAGSASSAGGKPSQT